MSHHFVARASVLDHPRHKKTYQDKIPLKKLQLIVNHVLLPRATQLEGGRGYGDCSYPNILALVNCTGEGEGRSKIHSNSFSPLVDVRCQQDRMTFNIAWRSLRPTCVILLIATARLCVDAVTLRPGDAAPSNADDDGVERANVREATDVASIMFNIFDCRSSFKLI